MIDLALDVNDLYAASDPIPVPGERRRGPTRLAVVTVDVESSAEVARSSLALREDGWQDGEIGPLTDGVYPRDCLRGGSGRAVTDLVTVLAE